MRRRRNKKRNVNTTAVAGRKLLLPLLVALIVAAAGILLLFARTISWATVTADGYLLTEDVTETLTEGADEEDLQRIELLAVSAPETIYKRAKSLLLGEDLLSFQDAFPEFLSGSNGIRFFDDGATLITEALEFNYTSYNGLRMVDGYTFNEDNTQADADRFILISVGNALYINAQSVTLTKSTGESLIAESSILYFDESAIRAYVRTDGVLTYCEYNKLDSATITIGALSLSYADFYSYLTGATDAEEYTTTFYTELDEEEEEADLTYDEAEAASRSRGTGASATAEGTSSTLADSSVEASAGAKKSGNSTKLSNNYGDAGKATYTGEEVTGWAMPEVETDGLTAGVYHVYNTVSVTDEYSVLVRLNYTIYWENASGVETAQLRKTITSSKLSTTESTTVDLSIVPPGTKVRVVMNFTYKDANGVRCTSETVLDETITTLTFAQGLANGSICRIGVTFDASQEVLPRQTNAIALPELTLSASDLSIMGDYVSTVAVVATAADKSTKTMSFKGTQLSSLLAGEAVSFDSGSTSYTDFLASNSIYSYQIIIRDKFGNDLPISLGSLTDDAARAKLAGNVATAKKLPTVTVTETKDSSTPEKKYITVTVDDSVKAAFYDYTKQSGAEASKLWLEVSALVSGEESTPVISPDDNTSMGENVTLRDNKIYLDIDSVTWEDGKATFTFTISELPASKSIVYVYRVYGFVDVSTDGAADAGLMGAYASLDSDYQTTYTDTNSGDLRFGSEDRDGNGTVDDGELLATAKYTSLDLSVLGNLYFDYATATAEDTTAVVTGALNVNKSSSAILAMMSSVDLTLIMQSGTSKLMSAGTTQKAYTVSLTKAALSAMTGVYSEEEEETTGAWMLNEDGTYTATVGEVYAENGSVLATVTITTDAVTVETRTYLSDDEIDEETTYEEDANGKYTSEVTSLSAWDVLISGSGTITISYSGLTADTLYWCKAVCYAAQGYIVNSDGEAALEEHDVSASTNYKSFQTQIKHPVVYTTCDPFSISENLYVQGIYVYDAQSAISGSRTDTTTGETGNVVVRISTTTQNDDGTYTADETVAERVISATDENSTDYAQDLRFTSLTVGETYIVQVFAVTYTAGGSTVTSISMQQLWDEEDNPAEWLVTVGEVQADVNLVSLNEELLSTATTQSLDSLNLLDASQCVENYWLNANGTTSVNTNTWYSHYIKVTPGDVILIYGISSNATANYFYFYADESADSLLQSYAFSSYYYKKAGGEGDFLMIPIEDLNDGKEYYIRLSCYRGASSYEASSASTKVISLNALGLNEAGASNRMIVEQTGSNNLLSDYYYTGTGSVSTRVTDYIPVKENTNYFLGMGHSNPDYSPTVSFYDENKTLLEEKTVYPGYPFETPEDTAYITIGNSSRSDYNTLFLASNTCHFVLYELNAAYLTWEDITAAASTTYCAELGVTITDATGNILTESGEEAYTLKWYKKTGLNGVSETEENLLQTDVYDIDERKDNTHTKTITQSVEEYSSYCVALYVQYNGMEVYVKSITFTTEEPLYTIGCTQDLWKLAVYPSAKFIMIADVETEYTSSYVTYFYGAIDGQGYTLTNRGTQIINTMKTTAVVKNLELVVDWDLSTLSRERSGLVYLNYGTISNIIVHVQIEGTSAASNQINAIAQKCYTSGVVENFVVLYEKSCSLMQYSGAVGYCYCGTIRNGYAYVADGVTIHFSSGEYDGNSTASISRNGLIVGRAFNCTVENVYVCGDVYVEYSSDSNSTAYGSSVAVGSAEEYSTVKNVLVVGDSITYKRAYGSVGSLLSSAGTPVIGTISSAGTYCGKGCYYLSLNTACIYTKSSDATFGTAIANTATLRSESWVMNVLNGDSQFEEGYVSAGYFPKVSMELEEMVAAQPLISIPVTAGYSTPEYIETEIVEGTYDEENGTADLILTFLNQYNYVISDIEIEGLNVTINRDLSTSTQVYVTVTVGEDGLYRSKYNLLSYGYASLVNTSNVKTYTCTGGETVAVEFYRWISSVEEWNTFLSSTGSGYDPLGNYRIVADLDFDGQTSGRIASTTTTAATAKTDTTYAFAGNITGRYTAGDGEEKTAVIKNYAPANGSMITYATNAAFSHLSFENLVLDTSVAMKTATGYYQGLIGYATTCSLDHVQISGGGTENAYYYAGLLVGYALRTSFTYCSATDVTVTTATASSNNISNITYVGGLAGQLNQSTMESCFVSAVSITAKNLSARGGAYVGGIVGYMEGETSLNNFYATGSITTAYECAGGVVGCTSQSSITDGWVDVDVTGEQFTLGGLCGYVGGTHGFFANILVIGDVRTYQNSTTNVNRIVGNNAGSMNLVRVYAGTEQKINLNTTSALFDATALVASEDLTGTTAVRMWYNTLRIGDAFLLNSDAEEGEELYRNPTQTEGLLPLLLDEDGASLLAGQTDHYLTPASFKVNSIEATAKSTDNSYTVSIQLLRLSGTDYEVSDENTLLSGAIAVDGASTVTLLSSTGWQSWGENDAYEIQTITVNISDFTAYTSEYTVIITATGAVSGSLSVECLLDVSDNPIAFEIASISDWKQFVKDGLSTGNSNVKITGDIDFSGIEGTDLLTLLNWSVENVEGVATVTDDNGNPVYPTIKNISCTSSASAVKVFATVTGDLSGLNFANITFDMSSYTNSYDVGYMGVIGTVYGEVSKVSFDSIEITVNRGGSTTYAGCIGRVYGEISDVSMTGINISLNGAYTAYLGGLVGIAYGDVSGVQFLDEATVDEDENRTWSSSYLYGCSAYVGGVVGCAGAAITVSDCTVEGVGIESKNYGVAGVLGVLSGYTCTAENCTVGNKEDSKKGCSLVSTSSASARGASGILQCNQTDYGHPVAEECNVYNSVISATYLASGVQCNYYNTVGGTTTYQATECTVENCTIETTYKMKSSNTTSDRYGASGIGCSSYNCTVNNCTITGSRLAGGIVAAKLTRSVMNVESCQVTNCTITVLDYADGYSGTLAAACAGIYANGEPNSVDGCNINNCTVSGCTIGAETSSSGYAIYAGGLYGGCVADVITDGTVYYNRKLTNSTVSGCTIYGSSVGGAAGTFKGGTISSVKILNTTIVGTKGTHWSGDVYAGGLVGHYTLYAYTSDKTYRYGSVTDITISCGSVSATATGDTAYASGLLNYTPGSQFAVASTVSAWNYYNSEYIPVDVWGTVYTSTDGDSDTDTLPGVSATKASCTQPSISSVSISLGKITSSGYAEPVLFHLLQTEDMLVYKTTGASISRGDSYQSAYESTWAGTISDLTLSGSMTVSGQTLVGGSANASDTFDTADTSGKGTYTASSLSVSDILTTSGLSESCSTDEEGSTTVTAGAYYLYGATLPDIGDEEDDTTDDTAVAANSLSLSGMAEEEEAQVTLPSLTVYTTGAATINAEFTEDVSDLLDNLTILVETNAEETLALEGERVYSLAYDFVSDISFTVSLETDGETLEETYEFSPSDLAVRISTWSAYWAAVNASGSTLYYGQGAVSDALNTFSPEGEGSFVNLYDGFVLTDTGALLDVADGTWSVADTALALLEEALPLYTGTDGAYAVCTFASFSYTETEGETFITIPYVFGGGELIAVDYSSKLQVNGLLADCVNEEGYLVRLNTSTGELISYYDAIAMPEDFADSAIAQISNTLHNATTNKMLLGVWEDGSLWGFDYISGSALTFPEEASIAADEDATPSAAEYIAELFASDALSVSTADVSAAYTAAKESAAAISAMVQTDDALVQLLGAVESDEALDLTIVYDVDQDSYEIYTKEEVLTGAVETTASMTERLEAAGYEVSALSKSESSTKNSYALRLMLLSFAGVGVLTMLLWLLLNRKKEKRP